MKFPPHLLEKARRILEKEGSLPSGKKEFEKTLPVDESLASSQNELEITNAQKKKFAPFQKALRELVSSSTHKFWGEANFKAMSRIMNIFIPGYLHQGKEKQGDESTLLFEAFLSEVVSYVHSINFLKESFLNYPVKTSIPDFWLMNLSAARNQHNHDAWFELNKRFPLPFPDIRTTSLGPSTRSFCEDKIMALAEAAAWVSNVKLIDHLLKKDVRFQPYFVENTSKNSSQQEYLTLFERARRLCLVKSLQNFRNHNRVKVFQYFLTKEAKYFGNSCVDFILHFIIPAIQLDDVELVRFFVEDPNCEFYFNPFIHVCNTHAKFDPQYLTHYDNRANKPEYRARTPFLLACEYGSLKVIKYFLQLALKIYDKTNAEGNPVLLNFDRTLKEACCLFHRVSRDTHGNKRPRRNLTRSDSCLHFLAKLGRLKTNPHAYCLLRRRDHHCWSAKTRESKDITTAEKYLDALASKITLTIMEFFLDRPTAAKTIFGGCTLKELMEHGNVWNHTASNCAFIGKRLGLRDILEQATTTRGLQRLFK